MTKKSGIFFGEIEYRNSLLFHEKPSETFLEDLKKGQGWTKFWGRADYAKPTSFFRPNSRSNSMELDPSKHTFNFCSYYIPPE